MQKRPITDVGHMKLMQQRTYNVRGVNTVNAKKTYHGRGAYEVNATKDLSRTWGI